MTVKRLTPEESLRVRELALRLMQIQEKVHELQRLPLNSTHEETQLPVIVMLTMLMESAGIIDLELSEVLDWGDER